jgi:hypothetical protein
MKSRKTDMVKVDLLDFIKNCKRQPHNRWG